MPEYILNANMQDSSSGKNYELHEETSGKCNRLPNPENRLRVGNYVNCHQAMDSAKQKYLAMARNIDGCYYCCPACHSK